MALRKIVKIGDNKLRKICKPVEKFDRRLKILLEDMADTMYDANGVGLAAPQVGILRRAVVIDVGDGLVELVNPVIVESDGQQSGPEGCLSIPGRSGVVLHLLGPGCTDDRRGHVVVLQHPGDGELRERQPELVGDLAVREAAVQHHDQLLLALGQLVVGGRELLELAVRGQQRTQRVADLQRALAAVR